MATVIETEMTLETATLFVQIALAGLCLFCGNLLLMRRQDQQVYLPLALLFLFQGITSLSSVVVQATGHASHVSAITRMAAISGTVTVACPFLFWLYVRALTDENVHWRPENLRRHVIPIVVVALLMATFALIPSAVTDEDFTPDDPTMIAILLISFCVLLGESLFQIMIGVYLILTIRRLRRYNRRLRDVFASTENRELRWIWAITVAGGVFWLLSVGASIALIAGAFGRVEESGLLTLSGNLALLGVYWVIGVWGLRQRPGLTREPLAAPEEPDVPPVQKYEKSALDEERAARIAGKIEAAMADDLLYRDPNLSLWDLSKHIGVTSHNVSQTLNTALGSSFFDYVNRWRIKDAVAQLTATDETILMIAYDVGFNSRSAFYKAFKRETGDTPSNLRK